MRSPDGAGRAARLSSACAALVLSALVAACSSGGAKAPNPTRSLDERRAIEVIRRAIAAEGGTPTQARDVTLVSGKTLRVDVSVDSHEYGIAYITAEDQQKLGAAIPPPNQKDERLRLARAGDGGNVRIVLLYQDNYLFDDLAGEQHEQTTITCESALMRDVRDFITYARTQKYP